MKMKLQSYTCFNGNTYHATADCFGKARKEQHMMSPVKKANYTIINQKCACCGKRL